MFTVILFCPYECLYFPNGESQKKSVGNNKFSKFNSKKLFVSYTSGCTVCEEHTFVGQRESPTWVEQGFGGNYTELKGMRFSLKLGLTKS